MQRDLGKNLKWSVIEYESNISRVKTIIERTFNWSLGAGHCSQPVGADDSVRIIDAILFSAYHHWQRRCTVYHLYGSINNYFCGVHGSAVWDTANVFWVRKEAGGQRRDDVFGVYQKTGPLYPKLCVGVYH